MNDPKPVSSTRSQPGTKGTTTPGIPPWVLAFGAGFTTFLVYLPSLRNAFVGWDDPDVVVGNVHIRSLGPSFFGWVWTSFHGSNWMPLTWLSYALDYQIGGAPPGIYHFTNILFHALNTALVFLLCKSILDRSQAENEKRGAFGKAPLGWPVAFFAAVLFGIHPLQVESVAWISERNHVLFTFFYLMGLLLYLRGTKNGPESKPKLYWVLVCFVLALMSKALAVTLPIVLLLLDFWPLYRLQKGFWRSFFEKIPFFLASLAAGVVSILAQARSGAMAMVDPTPLGFRILNAFRSLEQYLRKMILPYDLVPLYPFPKVFDPLFLFQAAVGILGIAVLLILCVRHLKTRPYLGVALAFFLATLSPVLGLLQVGSQSMADRYVYLPSLALFFSFSAGLALITRKNPSYFWFIGTIITVLLFLTTVQQIGVWKDTVSLWERVLDQYPQDAPAFVHSNLAAGYEMRGRLKEALDQYDAAIALKDTPQAHSGKAAVCFDLGRREEAIQEFKTAITMDPQYVGAHKNLARAYHMMGMEKESEEETNKAMEIQKNSGF